MNFKRGCTRLSSNSHMIEQNSQSINFQPKFLFFYTDCLLLFITTIITLK